MVKHQFSGKYAHVNEFLEGGTITDTRLYSYMGYLKNLNISNVLYVYYTLDGTDILLEHNNTIYMGDMMNCCL